MTNLTKHNVSSAARTWVFLAVALCGSGVARAEVTLAEKDGWTFSFDGRVSTFLSAGWGDDFPQPIAPPDNADGSPGWVHNVMGFSSSQPGIGRPDVGWPSAYQADANNGLRVIRIRSGVLPNILGFTVAHPIGDGMTLRGHISIWSTIETLGRDKWFPIIAEAKEGYFELSGGWGMVTAGKMLGYLGRMSYEIDLDDGHGFGLGLPCADSLGPACGHVGTGALNPGYAAGVSYATPRLGGFQINAALFDPAAFEKPSPWYIARTPRTEGSLTFDRSFGKKIRIRFGVEGLYQTIGRIQTSQTDPNDPSTTVRGDVSESLWGMSGGLRLQIGPVHLGASGFQGKGTGLNYVLLKSVATNDDDQGSVPPGTDPTYKFRTFTGYYAQAALKMGRVHLAGGYGIAAVSRLPTDDANYQLSPFHYQMGISAAVYFRISDALVWGLDYFRYGAKWYGAPVYDSSTMALTGGRLPGETQNVQFVNSGVTYYW